MTPPRLRDGRGWTVEPAVIDGLPQFIVRDTHGFLPYGLGMDPGPITDAASLSAAGVDIATLSEIPVSTTTRKARA